MPNSFLKPKKLFRHAFLSKMPKELAGRSSVVLLFVVFLLSLFASAVCYANTYATWKTQVFTVADQGNAAVSGETANPSGDGISNLQKYAFGLNPYQSVSLGKPTTSVVQQSGDSYLTLTYQVPSADPPTDILYTPQSTPDLFTWSQGSPAISLYNTTGPTNGFNFYTYMANSLPFSQNQKAFMRVQVTETAVINLASGTLNSPQYAIITGPPGAHLYYTIDGTTPSTSSNLYTGPIAVNSSQTIKVQTYVSGQAFGGAAVANYTLDSGTFPGPSTAPTAPSGLTGVSVSGEVDLSWTNNATNASANLIQQQNSDNSWTTVATLDPSQNFYENAGLSFGSNNTFRVVAVNTLGQNATTSVSVHNKYPLRYFIIDLGANLVPKKITNSGYVLLKPPGSTVTSNQPSPYRWANGVAAALQTQSPSTAAVANDIAEDGTVVGTQTAYPPGYISGTQYQNIWTGIWSFTIWGGTSNIPTSVSFAPVVNSVPPLDGDSIWGGDLVSSSSSGSIIYSTEFVPSSSFGKYVELNNGSQMSIPTSTSLINGVSSSLIAGNNSGDVIINDSSVHYYFDTQQLPSGFLPNAISNAGLVAGTLNGTVTTGWWDGTAVHGTPSGFSTVTGQPTSINAATAIVNGTTVPAAQMLVSNGVWEMNPATGQFESWKAGSDLIASSNYSLQNLNYINDNGLIVGTAFSSTDNKSHAVLLLPIQSRVASRDDPTQTWASNVLQTGMVPIYAGQTNGDLVSWAPAIPSSWLTDTFTWTVTDNQGNPVTDSNGTTITGPSGVGVSEWRIAPSSAGGNDPHNQWLMWKPGTYKITCTVSIPGGGTIPITFPQEVGQRTKDVVVIGWIDPSNVPLSSTNVDSDVLAYFPLSGPPSDTTQKVLTTAYLGTIAAGSTNRPLSGSLTSTDKTYILDWMFKNAANSAPPSSFADESTLEAFDNTPTNYKLFNRLQFRYLVSGSQFAGAPAFTLPSSIPKTDIGSTTDPIWGTTLPPHPGQVGQVNGMHVATANNTFHQINEGSPDSLAVSAFNTLMAPLKWNDIGSRIDEGVLLDQGTPPVMGYTVETQVYPTYYIYERGSNGGFSLVNTIPQASSPSGNFNSNPYPPSGTAPFLITP